MKTTLLRSSLSHCLAPSRFFRWEIYLFNSCFHCVKHMTALLFNCSNDFASFIRPGSTPKWKLVENLGQINGKTWHSISFNGYMGQPIDWIDHLTTVRKVRKQLNYLTADEVYLVHFNFLYFRTQLLALKVLIYLIHHAQFEWQPYKKYGKEFLNSVSKKDKTLFTTDSPLYPIGCLSVTTPIGLWRNSSWNKLCLHGSTSLH